jgi:hypothetical protein
MEEEEEEKIPVSTGITPGAVQHQLPAHTHTFFREHSQVSKGPHKLIENVDEEDLEETISHQSYESEKVVSGQAKVEAS